MCGITGVVLRGAAPVDPAVVHAMTDAIAHRGPDGDGFWSVPGVAFGHRRLRIIDLSELAAQPMADADGATALTFNGEIYNFVEVRHALEAAGDRFRSSGDTEVLYRALKRWHAGAIERVQGMFAFGFWSAATRELILARDRFGKKPLYYAPFGTDRGLDGIAFASELRALLAHPRVRAERAIDSEAVAQYLFHEFVPAPRSILRNVRKLMPGHYLRWRDGEGLVTSPYYVPRYHRGTTGTERELVEEFTRLTEQATRDRLVADVPVGIFLSGGLDSSLVAACATRVHPNVRTFAIGFDDPSFDESEHAHAVAKHLGTHHTEERLSSSAMLDLLPSTLDWIDEPFADSSLLPTMLLARVARRDVTVALGGDGGDELLAGYPTFQVDHYLQHIPALPSAIARVGRAAASLFPASDGNFSLGFKARQFANGLDADRARRHARWLAAMLPEHIEKLFGPRLAPEALRHVYDAVDAASESVPDDFDAATAFYLRVYLGEGVLTKVDRATMRTSLEARAPLLDTRLVEFCLGLDPSLRIRGRTTKWLMRQALAPMVPASIVERPKKGFGAPVGAWLRGPLAGLLRDTLSPSRLDEAGWVRPQVVQSMIDAHVRRREDFRKPLYALLVLEHWRQRWFA